MVVGWEFLSINLANKENSWQEKFLFLFYTYTIMIHIHRDTVLYEQDTILYSWSLLFCILNLLNNGKE